MRKWYHPSRQGFITLYSSLIASDLNHRGPCSDVVTISKWYRTSAGVDPKGGGGGGGGGV